MNEYNPVLISNISTADFGGAAAADEHVIFVAPFDCYVRNIYITVDAAADAPKFNFWKGIASDTKSVHSAFNTALVAHVPMDIGALDDDNRYVPKGTTITAKEDTGTADAVAPVFSVLFNRV